MRAHQRRRHAHPRWNARWPRPRRPLLGLGLYLSFSRGALFACVAGLVTLIVAAPQREQLAAIGRAVAGGVVASLVASRLRGVTALAGSLSTREHQGLIMLLVLVALAVLAGVVRWRRCRREQPARLRLPAHAPCDRARRCSSAGLALAIVVGNQESSRQTQSLSSGASRLVTLRSNRYAYWRVALRAFGDEPLRGVGAGGWSVYWLRDRTVFEAAQDAHSLPLQTAAELGVVGLALLAAFLAGVALAAARGRARRSRCWRPARWPAWSSTSHTPRWTGTGRCRPSPLVAMVLAGALLALSGRDAQQPDRDAARRPRPRWRRPHDRSATVRVFDDGLARQRIRRARAPIRCASSSSPTAAGRIPRAVARGPTSTPRCGAGRRPATG